MVDIIVITNTIFQMHIVVDRSKNVFFCDMLRNKIMDISDDCSLDILKVIIFFQNFLKDRVIY